jgi:hypothetical protein
MNRERGGASNRVGGELIPLCFVSSQVLMEHLVIGSKFPLTHFCGQRTKTSIGL